MATKEKADSKKWRKVERIGSVTIYRRGPSYNVYYRENGRSLKVAVGRNLNSARRTASEVNSQLHDGRPSAFNFERIAIADFARNWLDHCKQIRGLSFHTCTRYRAAIGHFVDYAKRTGGLQHMDQVSSTVMEDFLKHMRCDTRTRNGGREKPGSNPARRFSESGVAFVLSTCRTAFEHAIKRRHLPPYSGNPCSDLPIDAMSRGTQPRPDPFDAEQEAAFYAACGDWPFGIFFTLGAVGLRRDELRFLLVSDVDWQRGVVHIRSKPEFLWETKTRKEREIPIFPLWEQVLRERIGSRREGFVFLHQPFFPKGRKLPRRMPAASFKDHAEMAAFVADRLAGLDERVRDASEMEGRRMRVVMAALGSLGQIPPNRIRQEFIKLTRKIGLPGHTRMHEMRSLFATSMQEAETDVFARREVLGHASLDMTGRYTRTRTETVRREIEKALARKSEVMAVLKQRLSAG